MENRFEYLKRLVHESTGLVLENSVPVFLSSNEFAATVASLRSAMLYGKVIVTSSLGQAQRWLVFSLAGKIVMTVDLQTVSELSTGSTYHDRPVVFQNGFEMLFDEVYLTADLSAVSNLVTLGAFAAIGVVGLDYNVRWHLSAPVAAKAPGSENSFLLGLNTSATDPLDGDEGQTFVQPTTQEGTAAIPAVNRWTRAEIYGFPFQWYQQGTILIKGADGTMYYPGGEPIDYLLSVLCQVPGGTFDVYALDILESPDDDRWETITWVNCVHTEVWYKSFGLNVLFPFLLGTGSGGDGGATVCWNGAYRFKINKGAGTMTITVYRTSETTPVRFTWTSFVDANGYFDLFIPARPATNHYGKLTFTYTAAPPPGAFAKIVENSRSAAITFAINELVWNMPATTTNSAVMFTEPSTIKLVSDTTLVHQIHVMNGATVINIIYIGGAHGTTKSISAISGFTKLKFIP